MLRRLFLGQPRRDEIKDGKKEIGEKEESTHIAFVKESTANNSDEKQGANDDIFDSDSETESSETEDSDTETLDNSSRTGSFEDCSGDVLGWKGFEMVRNTERGQRNSNKCNEEKMENPKGQENPFANAFEIQENKMPHIHDEIKSEIFNNNNVNNNNNDDKHGSSNNNKNNQNNDSNYNNNSSNNNYNNESNIDSHITSSKTNNKQTHQENDNETATALTAAATTQTQTSVVSTKNSEITATKNLKNNTNDDKKDLNNSIQKLSKTRQTKFDQSKTTLQFPKPSSTNQKPSNIKAKGISHHYSIRENQQTSKIKVKTSSKIDTGSKTLSSASKLGKDSKWQQVIGKDKSGLRGTKIGNKGKQGNPNSTKVSVQDLENILGVNLSELKEVIKTYKSEKIGTAEGCPGQNNVAQGSPEMVGDNLVDRKNSQNGCKKDETKERKSETLDNKDEVSSDSGVSEPEAHSTCSQPHYITLKAIIKRKEYLEGQIKKLVDQVVVMGNHKKDIQFVHDLFDLHSDGLAKVERSNGGVACVTNLKTILARQLSEIDEEEFKAKLKSLEDLGIPNFSEINARIEKLRKRIRHTLDDERKCRSKGVQKLRFEIGKVQGMCEAVLDLVYTE